MRVGEPLTDALRWDIAIRSAGHQSLYRDLAVIRLMTYLRLVGQHLRGQR